MDEKDLKIFNLSMELWKAKNDYEYNNIVIFIREHEEKNLLECNNFYIKNLRNLMIEFGYVAVENYFIKKAEEAQEEVKENE